MASLSEGLEQLNLAAEIDGRSINADVVENKVLAVTFSGTEGDVETTIFDAVCNAMVGHSLREAAEHSALYAARELRAAGKLPEERKGGIGLPKNLNPDLGRAEAILRKMYRSSPFWALEAKEWNYEDRGISPEWVALPKPEKKAKVGEYLTQFLDAGNIARDSVVRFDIDKYERIDIQISDFVAIADKPELLMGFERYLRTQTKERLEVFAFEMKDLNRIRRL